MKKSLLTPLRVTGALLLLATVTFAVGWWYLSDKNIAVFNPQGIIATQQKDLILFTLALSLVVVVPVFVMLGVIAWKYREGNEKATYRPDDEGSKWLEIIWWGIPILIIGILSVVTWVSTHQLDPYKSIASAESPVKVQVIALQWKWLFLYPEYDTASVNELRMPVGTPVDFEITADAPMSAFWIPNLGSQTYAMNGMSSKLSLRADKQGLYKGTNTNINGEGYAEMEFDVIAMKDKQSLEKWMKEIEKSDKYGLLNEASYSELKKPSRENTVKHYHFYDSNLYNNVMQKYMPAGHGGQH